jgi:hypothetical protein
MREQQDGSDADEKASSFILSKEHSCFVPASFT